MTPDLYAELDDKRRAFINAADRLSNAATRADTRNAAILVVDVREALAALQTALKTLDDAMHAERDTR